MSEMDRAFAFITWCIACAALWISVYAALKQGCVDHLRHHWGPWADCYINDQLELRIGGYGLRKTQVRICAHCHVTQKRQVPYEMPKEAA